MTSSDDGGWESRRSPLAIELDGLRAGLAETEAISRKALASAPMPADGGS